MVTLIESTVSATTRHSDNAPIASEAAMALVNREEATGTERVSKPAVPGDRIIGQILACAGESPTDFSLGLQPSPGNIAAGTTRKMAKPRQIIRFCPLFMRFTRNPRYSEPGIRLAGIAISIPFLKPGFGKPRAA